jgi:hypothetical protein
MSDIRESPLACNANALNAQQRQRIRLLLNEFRTKRQAVRELPNGYSVRLPGEASIIREAAELITLERLCCPFFDFALEARREAGPVCLTLTGRAGVKEITRIEFELPRTGNSSEPEAGVKESPLVCNDGALNALQRERLVGLLREFRAAKQETRELADGYAFRLPASAGMIQDLAEYMSIVRLCSPYFETTLEVECEGGPVWLKITGRDGVKELVRTELRI